MTPAHLDHPPSDRERIGERHDLGAREPHAGEERGEPEALGNPAIARVKAGSGWIEVEDQGPGFPDGIEPMFEKFSRGVEGDGRPPGTGLGLSIARGFLKAQGGSVEAENLADGKGARVRLSAPLAAAALAEPA